MKRDGEQAWIWTFRTENHTLYAVRESRGSDVPEEVLGEDFTGTVVCDGWIAYPAFSDNLQRVGRISFEKLKMLRESRKKAKRFIARSNSCTSLSSRVWRAT